MRRPCSAPVPARPAQSLSVSLLSLLWIVGCSETPENSVPNQSGGAGASSGGSSHATGGSAPTGSGASGTGATAGTSGTAGVGGSGGAGVGGAGGTSAGGSGGTGVGGTGGTTTSRTPIEMLLVDEGNAAVHFVDLEDPDSEWSYHGSTQLRDIQLIGNQRVMLSRPEGYVELDLGNEGTLVREIDLSPRPGGIEAARRLPNGHTIVAGNGGGGIFVSEFDADNELVEGHAVVFSGLDKLRGMRVTDAGTFLFASDASSKTIVEGSWSGETTTLFTLPGDEPAGHMMKALPTGTNEITLSSGYGASLIQVDTALDEVINVIAGTDFPTPEEATRDLMLNFFAGYQYLANGDYVVTNWVGHGTGHNGDGYQLLQFDHTGELIWLFDQTLRPAISSLHNVLVLDGLDPDVLHDDRNGPLVPVE